MEIKIKIKINHYWEHALTSRVLNFLLIILVYACDVLNFYLFYFLKYPMMRRWRLESVVVKQMWNVCFNISIESIALLGKGKVCKTSIRPTRYKGSNEDV